jgi:hypothetical protein
MAVLRWAILCDRTIIEAETNNLSIINVLDEIHLDRAPPEESAKGKHPVLIPHGFTAVQWWTRSDEEEPEKLFVRSRFKTPDGALFGGNEQTVDLTRHQHIRVVTRAPGFPWRGPGRYEVTIQAKNGQKWRTVERLSFRVAVVPPRTPAAPDKQS